MDGTSEPAPASRRARQGLAARSAAGVLLLLTAGIAAALGDEAREVAVGEFHRVHFSGAGTVRIIQGSPPRLVARGDPATLEALNIETRGGSLYIGVPGRDNALLLELQVPSLDAFVSEGQGRITGDDLAFERLRLEGSGAGSFALLRLEARELEVQGRGATRFDLTGQVGQQVVKLSGTGAYRAGELISDRTTVSVAGASDVRLWADERLDVEVSGAAEIRYGGSPRVEQRISGVASVLRIAQLAI